MFRLLSAVVFGALIAAGQQAPLPAQASSTITIHSLDGKSGKPISNEHLLIFLTNDRKAPQAQHIDRTTDLDGIVVLRPEDIQFRFIEVFVDWHILCTKQPNSILYATSEVLSRGLSSQNQCGHIKLQPKPGDLYIFARKRHWWEPT